MAIPVCGSQLVPELQGSGGPGLGWLGELAWMQSPQACWVKQACWLKQLRAWLVPGAWSVPAACSPRWACLQPLAV